MTRLRPLADTIRGAPAATFALTALGSATLLAHEGGYFPVSWGWSALLLAWVAALGAVLRPRLAVTGRELAFLGLLTAFAAWTGLSYLWSDSSFRAVLETQRVAVYVALAAAGIVLVRRATVTPLLSGLLTGVTAVAAYALATRLFPERLGTYDPVATYRLAEPLGYWNALGILAALGALLALGLALRAHTLRGRALAGGCLPILVTALYFTFGRGPWIALAVGIAVAVAADPRRIQLCAGILALGSPAAAALALAAQADALTRPGTTAADASQSGERLALALLVLVLVSGVAAAAFGYAEQRITIGRTARTAFASALLGLAVLALAAGWLRFGSPPSAIVGAYDAFTAPLPQVEGDLNERLFSLSGNGRPELWRVALATAAESPVIGTGAGSYELAWLSERPIGLKVRDAHSLYLETLAELGAVGLAALLAALALPLAAAARARRRPLVPLALGAYVAYLVHAGADWDWELTGVTAAALLCGVALLKSEGRPAAPVRRVLGLRVALVALGLVLAGTALPGLLSASGLAAGTSAAERADWADLEDEARRAARFAPWSPEPWRAVGQSRLARGDLAGARTSFERAVALAPREWSLWFDLARALEGEEQQAALTQAAALNPKSPEVALLRAEARGIEAGIEAGIEVDVTTPPEDIP
jgi:hypothetical protein